MRYVDKEIEAKAKTISNVFFLLAVAFFLASVSYILDVRSERRAAEDARTTLSGPMATEVARRLCVEIDDKNHLVVCPE